MRGSFTADWDMAASTRQVRKARRSSKKDLDFTGSLTRELDFKRSKGEPTPHLTQLGLTC